MLLWMPLYNIKAFLILVIFHSCLRCLYRCKQQLEDKELVCQAQIQKTPRLSLPLFAF